MVVQGGDREGRLMVSRSVLMLDNVVSAVRTEEERCHRLTTNNGHVCLDIRPDEDVGVFNPKNTIVSIYFH